MKMTRHNRQNAHPLRERQLTLDLPHLPAMGIEDFCLSECNREALAFIDRWPDWPSLLGILAGPKGSGKSHLGEIWKTMSGALKVSAPELETASVPGLLAQDALLIEDAHLPGLDEEALFHALNWGQEHQAHILITSSSWPVEWGVRLPDLKSRLLAAPLVELHEPDNALLCMVLVKLFADRQLFVDASMIEYLVARMERSLGSAAVLVEALDKEALAQKRAITKPLAAHVLESLHKR
jgi:chromosomal replication initiation ATPase DnaA